MVTSGRLHVLSYSRYLALAYKIVFKARPRAPSSSAVSCIFHKPENKISAVDIALLPGRARAIPASIPEISRFMFPRPCSSRAASDSRQSDRDTEVSREIRCLNNCEQSKIFLSVSRGTNSISTLSVDFGLRGIY